MKPIFSTSFFFAWLLPCFIRAQEVPQKIQDAYIAIVTKSGEEILEKSFLPDFSRPHPTQMFRSVTCFPGKKIMVRVLTAVKPSDIIFKVNFGKQEAKPQFDYIELKLGGTTYWSRSMAIDMRNVTNTSDMDVYAYDGNNIDLPVYLYFFSYK